MRPLAMRMPSASRSDLANSAAQVFSQIIKPGGAVGIERRADLLEVLLAEQVAALDAEHVEDRPLLGVGIGQLDGRHVALAVLGDDHQVEDPDGARILQLLDRRHDVAENLLPGKAMAMYSTGPMLMS